MTLHDGTANTQAKARIHLVAGARPNFMKIGPLYHAFARSGWAEPVLVNTGQHFSADMSDVFIRDLGLPEPHIQLRASGDTHATQTAAVLVAYEAACLEDRPAWVVVAGDVNSTLAACLAARKLGLPVAHLEAGLRSRDRGMPEEINRVAVDGMADLLWTPSADGDENLLQEGIPKDRIELVGNTMIDAYCLLETAIDKAGAPARFALTAPYVVVTMHRPVNVDTVEPLTEVVGQLVALQGDVPVVFPVHPRTLARLKAFGLDGRLESAGVRLLPPLSYVEFMSLVRGGAAVITDSGGVQEETSYLGIPCLTVRDSTERPVTVTLGTNRLIARGAIAEQAGQAVARPHAAKPIPFWDGHAADRCVDSLRARM